MGFIVKGVKAVVKAVVGVVKGVFKAIGTVLGFSKPKGNAKNGATDKRLSKRLEPEDFLKIVFGKTAMAVDLRYWEVHGTKNDQYSEVIAAAGHQVEGFDEFYIEDDLITFSGNNATGKYAGALTRQLKDGAQTTALALGSGSYWNSTAKFTGVAHYSLAWNASDEKKLPNGIPSRYTQVGRGARVYDPRKDSTRGGSGTHRVDDQSTWSYSTLDSNGQPIGRNNALQMLWYLIGWRVTNPQTGEKVLRAGRGVDPNDINFAEFIAAANDAEALQLYTDCILSTGDEHEQNESIISCDGLAGELLDPGGLWTYKIVRDDTADIAVSLTEDDIMQGDVSWNPQARLSELFNEVAGTYIDPSATSLYQSKAYPTVKDAAYTTADGYKKRVTHNFQNVQDPALAQKLARIKLNRARFTGEFSAVFGFNALKAQVWSIIQLTSPRWGMTNKLFRVLGQSISDEGVEMTLREEDPSIYAGGTVTIPVAPSVMAKYDPFQKVALTTLAAFAVTQSAGVGATVDTGVRVTWDTLPGNVRNVEVQYKPASQSVWMSTGQVGRDATGATIMPLLNQTSYNIQVRTVSIHGVPSDWQTVAPVSTSAGAIDVGKVSGLGGLALLNSVDLTNVSLTTGLLPVSRAVSGLVNGNVSISAGGALSGAGGGQVTVPGLESAIGGFIRNGQITIASGVLNGIGAGTGAEVDNTTLRLQADTVGVGGRARAILSRANGAATVNAIELPGVVQNYDITISGNALNGIGTGAGTAVNNAGVSISAGGALSGAGGGQVTPAGLETASGLGIRNERLSLLGDMVGTGGRARLLLAQDGSGFISYQPPAALQNLDITISNSVISGIGAGAGTAVANSGVNIGANGTLSGGGGGQVTIDGLGYLGSLLASSGDNMIPDPQFLNPTTAWIIAGGATVADDGARFISVPDKAVPGSASIEGLRRLPVQEGDVIIGEVQLRTYGGTVRSRVGLRPFNTSGGAVTATQYRADNTDDTAGWWQTYSFTYTVPAGTSSLLVSWGSIASGTGTRIDMRGLRLALVERNATFGAKAGTSLLDSGGAVLGDNAVLNYRTVSTTHSIAEPEGGSYTSNAASVTGRIRITIPAAAMATNSMISFEVDVYDYEAGNSVTYFIAGYFANSSGGKTWYQCTARSNASLARQMRVTYGYRPSVNASEPMITIGSDTTVWKYPKIRIRNVQAGYQAGALSNWTTGWGLTIGLGELSPIAVTIDNPHSGDVRAGVNLFDSGAVSLGDSNIKNSVIQIGSNGALTGGGGGQVTIGGLGYMGALNASVGENITNLDISSAAAAASAFGGTTGKWFAGAGTDPVPAYLRVSAGTVIQAENYPAIRGGAPINVRAYFRSSVASSGCRARVNVFYYNAAGSFVSAIELSASGSTTGWEMLTVSGTVPATAVRCLVRVSDNGMTTGTCDVGDIRIAYIEEAADVTKAVSGATQMVLNYDSTGALTTTLPLTSLFRLTPSGGSYYTSGVTWSVTVKSGAFASTAPSITGAGAGELAINSNMTTAEAVLEVKATYGGKAYPPVTIKIIKETAAASASSGSGGGTAGTFANDLSLVSTNSATPVAIGDELVVTTGTTATLIAANIECIPARLGGEGGWEISMKWQRWNGSAWVDIGSTAVSNPYSEVVNYDGFNEAHAGVVTCNHNATGLTAGTNKFRLMAWLSMGGTRQHSFTGGCSAQG